MKAYSWGGDDAEDAEQRDVSIKIADYRGRRLPGLMCAVWKVGEVRRGWVDGVEGPAGLRTAYDAAVADWQALAVPWAPSKQQARLSGYRYTHGVSRWCVR